jgi:hypothetical protein
MSINVQIQRANKRRIKISGRPSPCMEENIIGCLAWVRSARSTRFVFFGFNREKPDFIQN